MIELLERVQALIPQLSEGALPDVVRDTGGLGLCLDYSLELQQHLGGEVIWLDLATREQLTTEGWISCTIPEGYPRPPAVLSEHAVLHLPGAGVVIDLTARQYDAELPFPFIWPLS